MRFLVCFLATAFSTSIAVYQEAHGGSAFSGNKIDDTFAVVSIAGNQASLKGTPKNLKAGDSLYFARAPFEFKVASVTGSQVTIDLPASHDLEVGNSLMRNLTDSIKKSMDTQKRLNQALE